jgi:hypothetical protein
MWHKAHQLENVKSDYREGVVREVYATIRH